MAVNDALGTRMKMFYEEVPKTKLMRRTPVAIRIDGRAFHTFTRGFQKPFDRVLMNAMQQTMKYLCENIQGCKIGYCQSDEITLILTDYDTLTTSAWFDYEVQKLCSISASMATMAFNKNFMYEFEEFHRWVCEGNPTEEDKKLNEIYCKAIHKGAMFDARCFNIPKEEVTNLIFWRQLDATRNSIQMVGQANFSHKQLQNKSCDMIQDMLYLEKGINWNDYPVDCKRGAACIKVLSAVKTKTEDGLEIMTDCVYKWIIDKNMPILKGEDREYVDKLIYIGE